MQGRRHSSNWARATGIGLSAISIWCPRLAYGQALAIENGEQVAVNADLRHFGNASRTSEAVAAARGLVTEDQRLTVGVDVLFARNLGRNTLNVTGNAGYDFYRRNTQLNRERIGLNADLGLNLGPCLLDVSARVDRRQSDLETLSIINVPGIDGSRNTETVQTYGAEARCGYVYGLRPLAGFEHSIGTNSNATRKISNYRSDRFTAGVGYDHPVIGKLSLAYNHDKVSYTSRDNTPLAGLDGYKQDMVRVTVGRDIGSLLEAEISAGYVWLRPEGPGVPNFDGITWRVSGKAKIGTRLVVDASTESMTSPSLGAAASYSNNRTYDLRGTFALNQRFLIGAGANFSRRDYKGASGLFGPLLDNDKYRRFYGTVTYKATQSLTFVLDGGHERRDGNGTIYDYSSNYVGLRARLVL